MSNVKSQNDRIIFGLKVKQLRQERELSSSDLAKNAGLSISYLNEIEKGKKFPKEDKLDGLAKALGVQAAELSKPELSGALAPVEELLRSNFLNELPLELFGIELSKVVEIIANAPLRVGAFISTLVQLSRNYALREDHFFHGAMRAYQEMHFNYFEDIEMAAERFVKLYDIPTDGAVPVELLGNLLRNRFNYEIIPDGLSEYPELQEFHAVYIAKHRRLLLNSALSPIQQAFQFAKELGFAYMELNERSGTSTLVRVRSFEQVLNHFKASYFAVALLMNQESFLERLQQFFQQQYWDGEGFLQLMRHYQASPEMLFQRLTSLIPKHFGVNQLFFLRIVNHTQTDDFQIDRELHLNHQHHPHSNRMSEHYCRRWLSLSLLKDLNAMQANGKYIGTIVGAQRSKYIGTDDEYLCLSLARPDSLGNGRNFSVTIGFLLNDELKEAIRFWDDVKIVERQVHTTCERCAIADCSERAYPATYIEKKKHRRQMQEVLKNIMEA